MFTEDLHNHTTYSYDGSNSPEEIIENAIAHSVDVIGITDHQFSIGGNLNKYFEHINICKARYADKIKVLCGLEIGTRPAPQDFPASNADFLDYVIFESLDSATALDLYEFLEWTRLFRCPRGLAHTDIFALEKRYGVDILRVLKDYDLFWEINTSGNYNYYYDFLTNKEKQERVSDSGIVLSVGSDTHWVGDFNLKKLECTHRLID